MTAERPAFPSEQDFEHVCNAASWWESKECDFAAEVTAELAAIRIRAHAVTLAKAEQYRLALMAMLTAAIRPTICTHGDEPDECVGCEYVMTRAMFHQLGHIRALLAPDGEGR